MMETNRTYESLNDRQKAFVDAVAELEQTMERNDNGRASDNQYTYDDVADLMESKGYEPYGRNQTYKNRDEFDEIIEERVQVLANERNEAEGEVEIEGNNGNAYVGPEEGIDATYRYITESREGMDDRKEGGEGIEGGDGTDGTVTLEVPVDIVFEVIRCGEREYAKELFEQVVEGRA